jgi:hypothetical protein
MEAALFQRLIPGAEAVLHGGSTKSAVFVVILFRERRLTKAQRNDTEVGQ